MHNDAQLCPPKAQPQRTRITMHHGDCLEVMPTLKAASVDMVFADLPYGVLHHKWDIAIDLKRLWEAVNLVSKEKAAQVFTANLRLASQLLEGNKKNYRYDLVWDKVYLTGHLNSNYRPLARHEHIVVFYRFRPCYHAQKEQGLPYKRGIRSANRNYCKTKEFSVFTNLSGLRHPTSIVVKRSDKSGHHPTQKPVALLDWLIRTYSNSGDTVLDPVAGSFTTAVSAIRNGRHCIAIEKDKAYFEAGVKRVQAEIAASGAAVDVIIHRQSS